MRDGGAPITVPEFSSNQRTPRGVLRLLRDLAVRADTERLPVALSATQLHALAEGLEAGE